VRYSGLIDANSVGDAEQQHDRHVALAGFDPGDVALGYPRPASEFPARHIPHRAHGAHAPAKLAQELALRIRQTLRRIDLAEMI
jgi:hypothetical protein